MSDITTLMMAAAGGGVEETDPNFNQTVLLLHGDGTNGAQNNTFLDSSTNNFTITRNGNTTQGTFSPFSAPDGRWSVYFGGNENGTRLSCGSHNIGTSDFQVEAWIWVEDYAHFYGIFATNEYNTGNSFSWRVSQTTGLLTAFIANGGTYQINSASAVPTNQWVHVVFMRQSGTAKMYINGVLEADTENWSVPNIGNGSASTHLIGTYEYASPYYEFHGYISNLRFIIGTPTYSSNFTPSTEPLTTTSQGATASEVKVLACQSNRFVDNSNSPVTIIPYNDVKVTPFSPFAPTAAYDASVNGGSGYFDGTGDYLTVPDDTDFDLGSGNFTIQCWIYPLRNAVSFDRFIAKGTVGSSNWSYGLRLSQTTNKPALVISSNGSSVTSYEATNAIPLNAWSHIAATRTGDDFRLFVNGELASGPTTNAITLYNSSAVLGIGANSTGTEPTQCYLSNVQILKGTAIDFASTGIPTAPLTNVANTSLLLNFTNAGIFDQTGKNNLETVADARVDTSTKKYGTGSLEFDGTGDWLKVPNNPDIQLGTGDFTIEFWVYLATGDAGSARGLVAKGGASTGWLVSLDSSEKVVFTYTTSTITSSGAITTNAWNHIAVVREGTGSNETKIYIGGTNDGTGTVSTDFNQTEVMYIGANRAAGDPMKGFIDDLRITKGVARYTTTFTPPTKAFFDL